MTFSESSASSYTEKRRIAPVMGAAGADWLDRSERDAEEKPEAGLDSLGLKPGMVVADVGAGSGYMSLRMAVRVGSTGKVYAEDHCSRKILHVLLKANQATARLTNIETVLGTETDPKLPAGKLDPQCDGRRLSPAFPAPKNAAKVEGSAEAGWAAGAV